MSPPLVRRHRYSAGKLAETPDEVSYKGYGRNREKIGRYCDGCDGKNGSQRAQRKNNRRHTAGKAREERREGGEEAT